MSQISELVDEQVRKTAAAVRGDAIEWVAHKVFHDEIPMQKEAVLAAFCQYVGGEENLQVMGISLDNIFSLVAVNVRCLRKKMAQ